MKYDLARLTKNKAGPKRTVLIRPVVPMFTFQQELGAVTLSIPRGWQSQIIRHILPAFAPAVSSVSDSVAINDAPKDVLKSIMEAAGKAQGALVLTLQQPIDDWATRVEEWHESQFARTVKEATSVDVFPFISAEDFKPQIEAVVERNVALIKGLNDDMAKQIENLVWDGFVKGEKRVDMAKALQERVMVGKTRALFIARDQTTKIAGDLNKLRQEEAGIDQYKWIHSGKVNYRPEHKARNGKIFSWDKPPQGGHPGSEPNCGCTAQAYMEL